MPVYTYRSSLPIEELLAVAHQFIEEEGGPLHKHAYRAWWSSASELSVEPFIAFGPSIGGRIHREPAVLTMPLSVTDPVIKLQLTSAANGNNSKRVLLIIAGLLLLLAVQNQQWHAAVAAVLLAVVGFYGGHGVEKSTLAVIKHDLERSFQLRPI
ncbi:hypothetical protein [Hymenobacter rigui]|uniref:Uncharacterized protein n=1 Tax=Hymenobacter rigui TaxID=334424 RepID=A0A428KF72_9BACT|nr:hypothetical protein [Hymenobacter rigui]RSK45073.1 hypothetical protein EI291_19745 [Hymenobacter rigui]